MKAALLGTACLMALALPASAQTAGSETASATFMTADGQEAGTATLTQTPNGVLLDIDVTGVPAGEHGFHIHETGTCEGNFESAGGHYAGGDHEHGYMTEGGPHAGDMPNQFVQEDGVFRAHVLNANVTLGSEGDAPLFDDDGSAIIIHAGADDYESQPSGEAGERWACAVIEQG